MLRQCGPQTLRVPTPRDVRIAFPHADAVEQLPQLAQERLQFAFAIARQRLLELISPTAPRQPRYEQRHERCTECDTKQRGEGPSRARAGVDECETEGREEREAEKQH